MGIIIFAKKFGVGVTDFSIGFGREIFGWNDKSGTRWKICWIPLGGYVKFFGDRNVFSQSEQQELINKYNTEEQKKIIYIKTFISKIYNCCGGDHWLILFLAIIIFAIINMSVGKDLTPAVIAEVQEDSPAFVAGLKKSDKIISIDNNKVQSILEVSTFINLSTSERIEFVVLRNDQEISLMVKPNLVKGKDSLGNIVNKKMIGIRLSFI